MISFSIQPRLKPLCIVLGLFAVSVWVGVSQAAPAKNSTPAKQASTSSELLDTATVRTLYLDGDFDQAIEILVKGLKDKKPYRHEDSVFIFKHLGVMYAAKYETREKGKYYMHQLLLVEPTARIMDMYASDMIYMIFKNIQDEYEETRGKMARAQSHVDGNTHGNPVQRPGESRPPKEPTTSSGRQAMYWVGATTLVVATGVTAYFLMAEDPVDRTDHTIE
jgi:hypothetical protein